MSPSLLLTYKWHPILTLSCLVSSRIDPYPSKSRLVIRGRHPEGRKYTAIGLYPQGGLSYRRSVVRIGCAAATGGVAAGRMPLWIERPAANLRIPTARSIIWNVYRLLEDTAWVGPYGFYMGVCPFGGVSYRLDTHA